MLYFPKSQLIGFVGKYSNIFIPFWRFGERVPKTAYDRQRNSLGHHSHYKVLLCVAHYVSDV